MNLPWDLDIAARAGDATVGWTFDAASGVLRATVTNDTQQPLHVDEATLFATIEMPAGGGRVWLQGRYMQMDALVQPFGDAVPEGYDGRLRRERDSAVEYISREQVVVTLPSMQPPALLVGCLRMDRFFCDITIRLDAGERVLERLTVSFDLEGAVLQPGEALELPPIVLLAGHDAVSLMERYAAMVAAECGARVPDHVPTGWCSWYFFYNRVTEEDILANLAAMEEGEHPAEFFQIDDGFQSATGDWLTPNEKFPEGMDVLARRIRQAGFQPGLWLAPFVLHQDSQTLREHPEIALRTHDGDPIFVETWLGSCAVLDCSHPASAEWLRQVVEVVTGDWGYEYLKLDALAFAAVSGARAAYHEQGMTAPGNVRRGLEIIREAAGDETFILGCTCHFGPAIGLVDAMRVGPDVKEVWADGPRPSVRHAMRLTLQRNWMHGRWWANDPDCLIVRDTDTELTEAEVRFLATGIALSGGMVVASDDLPRLSEERRNLALSMFPPAGVAARPVDASTPAATAWRTEPVDGRCLVGILNWSDEERWVAPSSLLHPGEVAFDVFRAVVPGGGDVLLRPHEGLLWQIAAPGPTPRVVGDSGSLTFSGLHQRQVSGQVHVRNDLSRPRAVALESRGQVFVVTLAPGELRRFT